MMKNNYFKKLSLGLILSILLTLNITQRIEAEDVSGPVIPTTEYSLDLIVADIVILPSDYAVDPTGLIDSTAGINRAIQDCYDAGGGTVFLPTGKYRVTSNITVLPFTTLYGDYNDPDSLTFNGDYGTMIYADVETLDANFPSLFTIGGSAGVIGITIYYPYQTMTNVKPYPYTFEIPSFASSRGHSDHMASTIKDVTMINSYRGIAASITTNGSLPSAANEMIHLENIKGTILYKGFELYNSSEYGVVRDITINNNYWSTAASYLMPADKTVIDSFTSTYSIGMQIGDLEWVVFSNIDIQDYRIGIWIYDGLRRLIPGQPEIYFIGQFYNLLIQNTQTAMRIDNLYPNFGINIANSYISGSDYSIRRTDSTTSAVNIVGTDLIGDISGDNIYLSGAEAQFDSLTFDQERSEDIYTIDVPRRLYNVIDFYADLTGTFDSSQAIQNALDQAHTNGGGIVYLPSGYYKVCNSLIVYENTQLRGSSSVNPRDEIGLSLGTIIFADYGYTLDEYDAQFNQALITISGDHSGVKGIRFEYINNCPNYLTGTVRLHSYTVRATGNYNYVVNVSLAGSAYGIEYLGTEDSYLDSPFVQGINGTFYRKGINLKYTSDAYLDEILSNASVVSRQGFGTLFPTYYGFSWPTDVNGGLTKVYDNITRPNSYFFSVADSEAVIIKNSFTFASNTFLSAENSDLVVVNSSGDNLYPQGYLFRLNNSTLEGVNIMRYSGRSYLAENSTITIYNRLSLLNNTENDLVNNSISTDELITVVVKSVNNLPGIYNYDSSLDPEMQYPIIEDNDDDGNIDNGSGGSGLLVFYIIDGIILVLATGSIFLLRRKKRV